CGSSRTALELPADPQTEPSELALPQKPEREPNPEIEAEQEIEPELIDETPKPQLEFEPVQLRIPKLSADAEIQGTYYDDTETMEIVPSASVISWLKEGPIPGNDGNAILGGHNRWKGITGQLFNLDTLDIGDEMEIEYADGSSLTFRLESVFVYPLATADADSIMDLEGDARVTVITCKDPFNTVTGTSDNRIIAVFKENSVFAIPNPPIEPWPPIDPEEAESEQSLPDHMDAES
ncbi:MAG: sortase, partial [Peptococcaceae bacterium]|nr:sortase [Peptococcaceae bacterium]